MEDKELFDFFKNRSASFDEIPSNEVWNKIQTKMQASKGTVFFSSSRIIRWGVVALVGVVATVFFITKDVQTVIKNTTNKPTQNETVVETNLSEKQHLFENDSVIKNSDTLKRKKVFIKKNLITGLIDTTSVIKKLQPVLKIDSINVVASKVMIDSLYIRPQVQGNRLLFETKQLLSTTEFDLFVQKILEETKTNYGALIVIKAKGNKPFRQIVKFPEKTVIPKTTLPQTYYSTKLIVKDSMIIKDSIYFNMKK